MPKSPIYRFLIMVGCVAFAAAFALAQPAPKPAPKPAPPKPNPIVTITKLDKTVVRGQLISAEPDQLIVKAPGAAAGEPVTVRWSQIGKVSNGLTQEQATEQWKAQHTPEQLCPDCRGNRGVACKDCHGTGHDPAKLVDCTDCGGGGVLFCPNKKCDEGQVSCPRPCLKLTEGRWVKKPDGKMWRTFPTRGGSFSWSDGHLGELIETRNGEAQNLGRCPTCEGTTRVDCPDCAGMAYKICPSCHFEGKTGPACPTCELGRTPCATCNSTGLKKAA